MRCQQCCALLTLSTASWSSGCCVLQSQEKRQTAKAEKLEKIRKGEKAVDEKHRTAEQKKASKDFYKQVRTCAAIGNVKYVTSSRLLPSHGSFRCANAMGHQSQDDAVHTLNSCCFPVQMITDSHYVGEDYDVFGAWLGADAAAE